MSMPEIPSQSLLAFSTSGTWEPMSIVLRRHTAVARDGKGNPWLSLRSKPRLGRRIFGILAVPMTLFGGFLISSLVAGAVLNVAGSINGPDSDIRDSLFVFGFAALLWVALMVGTVASTLRAWRARGEWTSSTIEFFGAKASMTRERERGRQTLRHDGQITASFDREGELEAWTLRSSEGDPEARAIGHHTFSRSVRETYRDFATLAAWILILVTLLGWAVMLLLLVAGPEALPIAIPIAMVESVIQTFSGFGCFVAAILFLERFLRYPTPPRRVPDTAFPPADPKAAAMLAFHRWLLSRMRTLLLVMGFVVLAPRPLIEALMVPVAGVGLALLLLHTRNLTQPDVDIVVGDRTIGQVRQSLGATTFDLATGPDVPAPERLAILAFLAAR